MLKTMDPDVARALIDGHTDILSAEVEAEAKKYSNLNCPMCHEQGCEKRIYAPKVVITPRGPEPVTPFSSDKILPRGYAHCVHCSTDFNPDSGIILETEASIIHAPPSDLPPDLQRS